MAFVSDELSLTKAKKPFNVIWADGDICFGGYTLMCVTVWRHADALSEKQRTGVRCSEWTKAESGGL